MQLARWLEMMHLLFHPNPTLQDYQHLSSEKDRHLQTDKPGPVIRLHVMLACLRKLQPCIAATATKKRTK
jgi:hypothetical protein